jgi:NADH:ubiquinone oxidoreductase subunit H
MNALLALIISLLVYPGILFAAVAALIFGWVRSFARASTQGWSGLQPSLSLREVLRRMRQGSTVTQGVFAPLVQVLPVLAVLCPVLVLVFIPLPANRGATNGDYTADVVALVALLLGVPLLRIVLGWATPSPYTRLAATRSARQLLGLLVPLGLAVAVAAEASGALNVLDIALHPHLVQAIPGVKSPNLFGLDANKLFGLARIAAGVAYLTCLPQIARLTPIREGQGSLDLVGNELTELSGRELLTMRIAEWVQLIAALGLGIALFVLPFFTGDRNRTIAAVVAALVTAIGLGMWEGMGTYLRPREDNDAPLSIWFGTQTFLGIIAILLIVMALRYT